MLVHEVGELEQQGLTLGRLEFAPWPVESAPCRRDGTVNVLAVALGNPGEHLTGRGVDGLECLARGSLDPFAIDQHSLWLAVEERMTGGENIYGHGFTPWWFDGILAARIGWSWPIGRYSAA